MHSALAKSMATIDSNTKKEAPARVQHIQVMSELIRLPAASFGARLSVILSSYVLLQKKRETKTTSAFCHWLVCDRLS